METNNPQTIPDRVPSSLSEDYRDHFSKEFASHIANEEFRERVKKIIAECTETVSFKDKIKSYAGESFNDKLFKNGWALLLFFASLVAAGIVGRLL